MGDGLVLKGAQNVNEGVHLAQAGEEGGLFKRFLTDRGHIDEFYGGEGRFLWGVEIRELLQTFVGYAGHADMLLP